jgi:hypothetical protein
MNVSSDAKDWFTMANLTDESKTSTTIDHLVRLEHFMDGRQSVSFSLVALIAGEHDIAIGVESTSTREQMITGAILIAYAGKAFIAVETAAFLALEDDFMADARGDTIGTNNAC